MLRTGCLKQVQQGDQNELPGQPEKKEGVNGKDQRAGSDFPFGFPGSGLDRRVPPGSGCLELAFSPWRSGGGACALMGPEARGFFMFTQLGNAIGQIGDLRHIGLRRKEMHVLQIDTTYIGNTGGDGLLSAFDF